MLIAFPEQRPLTLCLGTEGGKRVNYSGLLVKKATKEYFNRVSQMVLTRIVAKKLKYCPYKIYSFANKHHDLHLNIIH